ncbi:MarR family transcriptional regulator [Curtobacterium sp. NPDC089185]|uniref:MarR family winged helix-turn-helix transcriptional regulator n=1 Tax=Curtobacterium sp. NPDC089185 TaxID=3154968 RepID=UPI003438842D
MSEDRARDVSAVASALRVGVGAFRRRLQDLKADGDLSGPQLAVLSQLEREPSGLTGAEIARREQISPQAVNTTVASLEALALVAKTPDPTDGRRVIIQITAAGRDGITTGRTALTVAIAEAMTTSLSTREIRVLDEAATLLQTLSTKLH